MKKTMCNGMIPIPTHLRPLSEVRKTSKTTTTVSLRCPCGCDNFFMHENVLTKEEKAAEKPYYDALDQKYCNPCKHTVDENGVVHYWRYLTDNHMSGPVEEIIVPERPYFSGISVVKLICAGCQAEYVVFDSRIHGYDAKTTGTDDQTLSYTPHFRQKMKQSASFEIKIENDESYEAFIEDTGLDFDEDGYADAFSWLWIYATNESGKKKKVFEFETA